MSSTWFASPGTIADLVPLVEENRIIFFFFFFFCRYGLRDYSFAHLPLPSDNNPSISFHTLFDMSYLLFAFRSISFVNFFWWHCLEIGSKGWSSPGVWNDRPIKKSIRKCPSEWFWN
jgi:hypothetical protein